jgi:hypothetical protein
MKDGLLVDDYRRQLRSNGFQVESATESGDVTQAILKSAVGWNADLILLGCRWVLWSLHSSPHYWLSVPHSCSCCAPNISPPGEEVSRIRAGGPRKVPEPTLPRYRVYDDLTRIDAGLMPNIGASALATTHPESQRTINAHLGRPDQRRENVNRLQPGGKRSSVIWALSMKTIYKGPSTMQSFGSGKFSPNHWPCEEDDHVRVDFGTPESD